ncbi:hypothetical protein [Paraburkholderia aromaticivorans]|uniref:hypothetical protein n=1 Tax=Paraburkholderia aromaticivorans TaxID=2026199 RepID=UPI0012FDAF6E|nr:hypothetical protein [Paraburkholderia aromaticivorans]
MSAVVSPLTSAMGSTQTEEVLERKTRINGAGSLGTTAFDMGTADFDPREHAPGTPNPTMCK